MHKNPYLEIADLSKSFGSTLVLDDVSFSLQEKEFVSILGPSGCGKTTLLRIIAGLESIDNGKLLIKGEEMNDASPLQRHVAMVFQSYALVPHMTALQNIMYALEGRNLLQKKLTRKERKQKAEEMLSLVQLDYLSGRYPAEMSGGQQQRIALARAIALRPSLLLLDEPLSALDVQVRKHLRTEIKELHTQTGMTTILVTHDLEEALSLSDKVIVLVDGKIVQVGSPEELYHHPNSHLVANFVGVSNQLQKGKESVFVRPEDMLYSWQEKEGYLACNIVSSQFSGPTFLLNVKGINADNQDEPYILTISSKEVSSSDLSVGKLIYVKPICS